MARRNTRLDLFAGWFAFAVFSTYFIAWLSWKFTAVPIQALVDHGDTIVLAWPLLVATFADLIPVSRQAVVALLFMLVIVGLATPLLAAAQVEWLPPSIDQGFFNLVVTGVMLLVAAYGAIGKRVIRDLRDDVSP